MHSLHYSVMKYIKKQNNMESISRIHWTWNAHLQNFCSYLGFGLRIVYQSSRALSLYLSLR
jgi:hypothetical protein